MSEPLSCLSCPPPADLVPRLSRVLHDAVELSGWRFSCEDSEFTTEEVTAPDGMLPMWMLRAQGWMAKSLGGQSAPMAYRIDGGALCGATPAPHTSTASLAVWACYLHFAVEQWRHEHQDLARQGKPVPMDELYKQWHATMRARQVPLLPPLPAPGMEMALGQPAIEAQRTSAGG